MYKRQGKKGSRFLGLALADKSDSLSKDIKSIRNPKKLAQDSQNHQEHYKNTQAFSTAPFPAGLCGSPSVAMGDEPRVELELAPSRGSAFAPGEEVRPAPGGPRRVLQEESFGSWDLWPKESRDSVRAFVGSLPKTPSKTPCTG